MLSGPIRRLMIPLAMALLASCASVQNTYIPTKMGSLGDSQAFDGVRMSLVPDQYRVKIGDLLTFSIILENISDKPIWIPKQPDFLLTWVYPDGKRDNLVEDGQKKPVYTAANAVLLLPGQEKTYRSVLSTYYFNRGGITEFRALVSIDNSHSKDLDPFWNGHAESNGFGVLLQE